MTAPVPMRPVLLNSCARAATAEELRYRIDRPIRPRRGARVVALDELAARVVRDVAAQTWNAARFYTSALGTATNGAADVMLGRVDGKPTPLDAELAEADVVVMVAVAGGDGAAASAIGDACARRGIMAAGIILGDARDARDVVTALRPHAQVLMVTSDEQDLSEVLTALRA
jgi:hypothetical protein